jgi:AAA+ ATPase superfamily predicted ATPase
MLTNPFTPSEIASAPDDFFGRIEELSTLERSLHQGSVAIQGPIGIGKSSLLARARLLMEGFNSNHHSRSVIGVCHRDIKSIDEMSRLVLESFVSVDEQQKRVKFKLGNVFEHESAEICKYFAEGRHLAALKRIVEEDYLKTLVDTDGLLILAIDEADKSPVPLARLIRSIATHTQQQAVKRVRFVLAGVSPFFQEMVDEDPGVSRFIYKTITLTSLPVEEAAELLESKFALVAKEAERDEIALNIDPSIITRIIDLSGGHPHLIQLLGSHVIEHESEDPDGVIDSKDLLNSLRRVCYEDRARVYDATVHLLDLHEMLDAFLKLLHALPRGFPSNLDRRIVLAQLTRDQIEWFVAHNILSAQNDDSYSLVDEFLRVRFILDQAEIQSTPGDVEKHLLSIQDMRPDEFDYSYDDYYGQDEKREDFE